MPVVDINEGSLRAASIIGLDKVVVLDSDNNQWRVVEYDSNIVTIRRNDTNTIKHLLFCNLKSYKLKISAYMVSKTIGNYYKKIYGDRARVLG